MKPLFSTAYMPPIAYMAALAHCKEAEIETKETFPKQTYRNRAAIMTAGGIRTLTVPTIRSNHTTTDEVLIDYKERWNVIHLRTIKAAYSASPYYLYYKDELEALVMQQHRRLIDLNTELLRWLVQKTKIDCHIEFTTDWHPPIGDKSDLRYSFSPKTPYPTDSHKPYYQVFADRIPFTPNLSVVDLLMNLGPEAAAYLKNIS